MSLKKQLAGHQLYHFTVCPYCVKVRLALRWMGIELPLKDILTDPEYRAELIAGGGKPQVPCLRIEEEGKVRWLYESNDIIRYLNRHRSSLSEPSI